MKKVLLILMLMTIGLSAQAEEEVLEVGGVSIDLSQDCVASYGLVSGNYRYYSIAKKIVFYDAKIKNTGSYGIYSTVDGLTILFNGENTIESKFGFYLTGTTYMSINSGGKVTVSSSTQALYANNTNKQPYIEISNGTWILNNIIAFGGTLTIKGGADVTINNPSDEISIYGNSQLTIDNSSLNINANSNSLAIEAPVVLKDCVIASPLRAVRIIGSGISGIYDPVYSASEPAYIFDTSGDYLRGNLSIKPGDAYSLWICGVQVNSLNYGDIWQLETTGSSNNEAYLSYNRSTKTLTLLAGSQLYSEYMQFPPIHNEISGLTINTYGCTIGYEDNRGGYGIDSFADCTINGNGSYLNVSGGEHGAAIRAYNSNITFNNIELTATGNFGLFGKGNSKIYANNSTLSITGSVEAISVENDGFDPDDNCIITYPANAIKFNNGVCTFDVSTGEHIPATIVYARQLVKYPLWINGEQITEKNCNHIKSLLDSRVFGDITFSPPNKLLIDGLHIYPEETLKDYFIQTTLDELILNLTGDSFVRASGNSLITTGNVTVNGTGTLNIDTGDYGMRIGGTLKITGSASFMGHGETCGIAAHKLVMTPGTLLSVSASSESGRSLYCDLPPELDGVALPADMYYNESKQCVCYKATDQPVARKYVKICADNVIGITTGIQDSNVIETDTPTRVYTPTGQLIWQGTGQPQLPSGIYIINGRAVVIK